MCFFHDFPALDLTSTQKGDIDDWDFSSLAHLLLYNSVRLDGILVFSTKAEPPRSGCAVSDSGNPNDENTTLCSSGSTKMTAATSLQVPS